MAETEIAPTKTQWEELLAEATKRPPMKRGRRIPYVAIGMIKHVLNAKENREFDQAEVRIFDMSGSHCLPDEITREHRKGHKILGYWFPKLLTEADYNRFDVKPGELKPTPYDEVAATCRYLMASDPQKANEYKEEIDALRRKVAELSDKKGKNG